MSDEQNFGDPNEDTEGIKNLRRAHKTQGQELETLKAQLAKFEAQAREKSVGDLMKAKGVNPAYAKFYAGDASEDSVGKWLEENKELVTPAQGEQGSTQSTTQTQTPELDANARAAQQISALSPSANTMPATFSGTAHGKTIEELQQILDSTPDTPEGFRQLQELNIFPKQF